MPEQKAQSQIYNHDTLFTIMRVYVQRIENPHLKDMTIRRFQKAYRFVKEYPKAAEEVSNLLTDFGEKLDHQKIDEFYIRNWMQKFSQIRKKHDIENMKSHDKKAVPIEKEQEEPESTKKNIRILEKIYNQLGKVIKSLRKK